MRNILWHPVAELIVLVLIVASIVLMIVEATLLPTDPLFAQVEHAANVITWIFFIELCLRWIAIGSFRRFFSQYWMDCLAVAPLLRPLRILRVLRLLRLFRLGLTLDRWAAGLENTFAQGYREYFVVAMIAATIVLTGAMSIFILEGAQNPQVSSFGQSVWWATFTMMAGEPVGGEPQTPEGRVVLLVLMLGGMTVFALLTGTVSALMVDRLKNTLEARFMQLDDLENHIVICGWNRGGSRLLQEIGQSPRFVSNAVVILADFDEGEEPEIDYQTIQRDRVYLVRGDYTRVQVIEDAGIRKASLAILLADKLGARSDQDRDARTVLAALSIEKLNPEIFTCVELLHKENAHPLKLAGVEEIVVASEFSSTIMAHASLNDGLVGLFEEVLTHSYGNAFHKEDVPESWIGKDFQEILGTLKADYDAILISAERRNKDTQVWEQLVNPDAHYRFEANDRFVYIARKRIEI